MHMTLTLFQVDTQFMLAKAGAERVVKTSDQMQKKPQPDPTVYCTSFKVRQVNLPNLSVYIHHPTLSTIYHQKRWFYCFSTHLPSH